MGAAHAFVYLSQQFVSFFPTDALQFHTVGPPSVQDVVDELVQGGPAGYSFRFFLLFGKLSSLEEMDYVPYPSWSLGLDNED